MFLTFFGTPRGDHHAHDHAHESPMVMLIPLGVLALGAVFSGMIWYNVFFGEVDKVRAWFGMPAEAHHAEGGAEHGVEASAAHGAGEATAVATEATEGHSTEGDAATAHGTGEATAVASEAAEGHGTEAAAPAEAAVTPEAVATPVQGALLFGPDNHVIHEAHEVPNWVKVSALRRDADRACCWPSSSTSAAPTCPASSPRSQRPLYLFLLNKWYFDEIYDFVFVRPAPNGWAASCGSRATAA